MKLLKIVKSYLRLVYQDRRSLCLTTEENQTWTYTFIRLQKFIYNMMADITKEAQVE